MGTKALDREGGHRRIRKKSYAVAARQGRMIKWISSTQITASPRSGIQSCRHPGNEVLDA
jgi:hypothetical protein